MNTFYIYLLLVSFQSGERLIEIKDVAIRNGLCYASNDTIPFTGSIVSYWVDGTMTSKSTYKNGETNGPYIEWWGNHQIKKINILSMVKKMESVKYIMKPG